MNALERFKLKVKRGDGPFYGWLRRALKSGLQMNLPVPGLLKPVLRVFYELHYVVIVLLRRMLVFFYKEPLFRSRCESVGRNLYLDGPMPFVMGQAEIHIGNNVKINGALSILSGRFVDRPKLTIQDRAIIGAGTVISVNREVVIEEDVMVATNCRIADNDGHPREADLRAQHAPLRDRDMRPVRICRNAWIGNGTQIMKGVTIGEGAIIGANSVVISSIPEYCMAMGNPAEIFLRNVGRPKKKAPAEAPAPEHLMQDS
ncbi:MAG TPA: acyltransferase [Bryobacteraceae bacterium]|nr:acyltransferase [Bryobacteraceae bacterium]